MFFTDQIDYNTRYVIGGTFVAGFALIVFSFLDRIRAKILTHPIKRDIYIRVLTIIAIAIIVGAIMSVNNSIADARKLEFLGPYTAQQIGVNRYLGELYKVQENTHNVQETE
jgi:quinol-cytochrome oxidoreductase complex cytochrome b subunit